MEKLDFEQVESKVSGITVFAPKAKQKEVRQAKSHTCPQCGGHLAYDLLSSGLACSHCGFKEAIRPTVVGPTVARQEFTVDTMEIAEKGWGKMRNMLHCQQCGAELSYPQGAVATSCPYCGSNSVNVTQSEINLFQPQALVPFKVKPDQLQGITQAWIEDGWMHPSALKESAKIGGFVPFYIPYWAFSLTIEADWEAEVAHTVTERYYDSSSKSWKTRTRVEWRWENGKVKDGFSDYLVSGVDKKRLNPKILAEIQQYNMKELVKFNSDYLIGINANAYDVDLPTAWAECKAQMREIAKNLAISDASNPRVRNLSIEMSYDNERWRYLFVPVYIAVYRFGEKYYQVMVNGQNGRVFGQKPIDWTKVWLAIAAMLLPGLLLTLIGLPLIAIMGSGVFLIMLGLALLVGGGIWAYQVYSNAAGMEAL